MQQENKLKLLEAVYDMAPVGVEVYDKEGRLIDCNSYDLKIFGIERKEDFIRAGVTLFNNRFRRENLSNGMSSMISIW